MEGLDIEAEYYYNIDVTVAILTAEKIKDLKKWLEIGEEEKESSTFTETSFKVVKDYISSRHRRKLSARSDRFHLHDLPKLGK